MTLNFLPVSCLSAERINQVKKNQFTFVPALPDCSKCTNKARFDLARMAGISWGFACPDHREGRPLGTGQGHLLVLKGEDPDAVLSSLGGE